MVGEDFASRLGIFARTFPRQTAGEVAAAIEMAGYLLAHWNFAAIGRSTLACDVDEGDFAAVRDAFEAIGLRIPSVSATYNVVHPDATQRAEQTSHAVRLIGMTPLLGADTVTLCTGTRDAQNMWRAHPDNTTPSAWSDLRSTLEVLMESARTAGVTLGVEPEAGNVIRNAATAERLLDEIGHDAPVGIIFDPANLLSPATIADQGHILTDAIARLGPRIIGAQAKDVVGEGYAAAGTGSMDYQLVFRLLDSISPLPLIVQDVAADDAARVRQDLITWHHATKATR